jgi:hypothetical protein
MSCLRAVSTCVMTCVMICDSTCDSVPATSWQRKGMHCSSETVFTMHLTNAREWVVKQTIMTGAATHPLEASPCVIAANARDRRLPLTHAANAFPCIVMMTQTPNRRSNNRSWPKWTRTFNVQGDMKDTRFPNYNPRSDLYRRGIIPLHCINSTCKLFHGHKLRLGRVLGSECGFSATPALSRILHERFNKSSQYSMSAATDVKWSRSDGRPFEGNVEVLDGGVIRWVKKRERKGERMTDIKRKGREIVRKSERKQIIPHYFSLSLSFSRNTPF